MARPKVLIIFYSWTGTTRRVAEALRHALDCDVEEIVETRKRSGLLGYVRAVLEARWKRPAAIAPAQKNPSSYDLVIIGTPVWAWSVSSPVRAWLASNKLRLPAVAFFCTLGGAGSAQAFAQMQALAGKPPRAVCAIPQRLALADGYDRNIAAFAKELRLIPRPATGQANVA
jgi:flavodoxin